MKTIQYRGRTGVSHLGDEFAMAFAAHISKCTRKEVRS
ncbi:hypothetical protein PACID_31920 [Acidipropionibacterium acidipropionici ATCC 4875]|uniref:Uncharacterized protein n=1 Tax=Acidipropionibacterium acidipropionici (strain ATCC 4875 / DSM 20272 / JCM 6432 / NBRC 12425 / NCIMB 8070 / 4) TaxID=1171373 RepID=K7S8S2_ACIA4|nr:hypothetical protein PACID_31920 [Acidipropionibacterium acidipropionici ATCC 4875]